MLCHPTGPNGYMPTRTIEKKLEVNKSKISSYFGIRNKGNSSRDVVFVPTLYYRPKLTLDDTRGIYYKKDDRLDNQIDDKRSIPNL